LYRGADAVRLVLDFVLESLKSDLPVSSISFPLPTLSIRDSRQLQLFGIEFGISFGDPLALLVEQFGQQFRFCLTTFREFDLYFGKMFLGNSNKYWRKVFDVSLQQSLDASDRHLWRDAGVTQRILKLI
jgi:hypothetical protein